jgi:hypothetical protein
MGMTLEVTEQGTLTLPAELLSGAKPHARFVVENRNGSLVVQQEIAEATQQSADEWIAEWDRLTDAVSVAWKSDASAIDIVSDMRR